MNKIFCTNCGNKMESAVVVNFCSKCGQALNGRKNIQQATIQASEEIEDTVETTEVVTDISKLKDKIKVSVEFDAQKPVKIGEYLEMAKASGPVTDALPPRRKDNLPKGKGLLKKIAEECASSRHRSSEIE